MDEVIVFRPLDVDDYTKIAKLLMEEYVGSLKERHITLTYDDKAARWLAEHSIGGHSGARDLRNLIRKEVEDRIASTLWRNGGKFPLCRGCHSRRERYSGADPVINNILAPAGILLPGPFQSLTKQKASFGGRLS